LIEVLISVGVVATLSAAVFVAINPAELLRQARDSIRLADTRTIRAVANLYRVDVGGYMGDNHVIYISLPDMDPSCGNLALPGLPTGWRYNCVPFSSQKNVNGFGWLPLNLSAISIGSPLSSLPIDPINTAVGGYYYSYIPNSADGNFSVRVESQKYLPSAEKTNTFDPSLYVVGSNADGVAFSTGLAGWWRFEEGVGATTTVDSSNSGNIGIWYGSGIHYATGNAGGYAALFNGTSDKIATQNTPVYGTSTALTVMFWFKKDIGSGGTVVGANGNRYLLDFESSPTNFKFSIGGTDLASDGSYPDDGAWHFVAASYNGQTASRYLDGKQLDSVNISYNIPQITHIYFGHEPSSDYISGLVDDLRVYQRGLSSADILAIYNATK